MTDFNPFTVAGQLTHNQAQTVRSLTRTPCVLGCAEATARRLSERRSTRPALVVCTRGAEYPEFALTDAGVQVQEQLGGPLK